MIRRRAVEQRRADERAAMICALLANVNRDSKRKPEPFTIEDFIGTPDGRPKEAAPSAGVSIHDYIDAMQERDGPQWKESAPHGPILNLRNGSG